MNLIDRFKGLFNRVTSPPKNAGWWTILPYRDSGVIVTHENALQLSACIACVRARAEDLGKIPWRVYKKTSDKRERQDGSNLDRLLNTRPNPEMGAMDFRTTLLLHAQTWGNGYAEIERDMASRPMALWPIEPWRVAQKRIDSELWYEVTNDIGPKSYLPARDVYHIKGLSENGITGMDTIANAAITLGFGIAAEEYGASFYQNNTTIGTSFKTPNKLTPSAFENLKNSIEKAKGSKKAFEGMIFEQGLEPVNVLINQTDSQYIETRKFQIEEVCRHFRMPPHKIFDLTNAHFNNVEHFNIVYVTDSLMPWAKRMEEEADYKLISIRDPRYTKLSINALMRGDSKSRMEFYQGLYRMAALSPNEIRAWEDLDPIEFGDEYFMQAQMRTVKNIVEQSSNQNIAQPMVTNMLKRFWDQDSKKAESMKSKLDFDQFCSWVNRHHEKIRNSRERAVADNIQTMELAYSKEFDTAWILNQYTTWATSSLIYFYRDQTNMIDQKAFTAYFLEALNNANTGEG